MMDETSEVEMMTRNSPRGRRELITSACSIALSFLFRPRAGVASEESEALGEGVRKVAARVPGLGKGCNLPASICARAF